MSYSEFADEKMVKHLCSKLNPILQKNTRKGYPIAYLSILQIGTRSTQSKTFLEQESFRACERSKNRTQELQIDFEISCNYESKMFLYICQE